MAPTVPCPGCTAPLPITQEVCDRCRRPRDLDEMEKAREELARRHHARKRLPWVIAGWLAVAAAAAAAYPHRAVVLGLVARVRGELAREMEDASHPSPTGKPLSPLARQLVGALAVPGGRGATGALPASELPVAAPPPAPPKPRRAVRPAAPPASAYPPDRAKRVYGVVYDLLTNFPVAGAKLTFTGANAARFSAVTDALGHYSLDVLGACYDEHLTVEAAAPGYREGQIEDTDPPYLDKPDDVKRSALEQLAPSDLEAFPLRCPPSASVVPLDVVLVPETATAP